ncbi:LuxR C-terminal-related transcriptional regulator [Pseudenterobacter timonensis]|uniref:LuxR C-terminal-related transcriptional regulator n=1 Tax=Pseudenterobacter timonensis TaxID=1755099 RepID=A0ABV4AA41_9ENTR
MRKPQASLYEIPFCSEDIKRYPDGERFLMNVIFLSDNYYLCVGTSRARFNVTFVEGMKEVNTLCDLPPSCTCVVAIEHNVLRNEAIKHLKKRGCRYIVLLNEIEQGCYVKINNTVYSSLHFNIKRLRRLLHFLHSLKQSHFTRREYDVLKLSHLENNKIARALQLSEKTTSTYRVKIQEKLNMRAKNMLAMHRIKSVIVDQRFESGSG